MAQIEVALAWIISSCLSLMIEDTKPYRCPLTRRIDRMSLTILLNYIPPAGMDSIRRTVPCGQATTSYRLAPHLSHGISYNFLSRL